MIQLIKVIISNNLDDKEKIEIIVFHSEDLNAEKHFNFIADSIINLDRGEKIIGFEKIKPINISTEKYYSDIIDEVIN